MIKHIILIVISFITSISVSAQQVKISHLKDGDNHLITLKNQKKYIRDKTGNFTTATLSCE